ncbi:hypothetical protein O9992_04215 [Vibrio lentus]|nr:hypothetical protein [Vibrio lentus]
MQETACGDMPRFVSQHRQGSVSGKKNPYDPHGAYGCKRFAGGRVRYSRFQLKVFQANDSEQRAAKVTTSNDIDSPQRRPPQDRSTACCSLSKASRWLKAF